MVGRRAVCFGQMTVFRGSGSDHKTKNHQTGLGDNIKFPLFCANGGPVGNTDTSAALADRVSVMAISAITHTNTCFLVYPGDLAAGTTVTKSPGRISVPEAS